MKPHSFGLTLLVHCPNHLARQWKEEVEKNTVGGKVALCCTINDFKKLDVKSMCTQYGLSFLPFNITHALI
jgi:hypothetical protein